MSSATLSHQPLPARSATARAPQETAAPAPARALTETEQTAHETRLLATITGVATVIILVFFLVMMWILSSYGPAV